MEPRTHPSARRLDPSVIGAPQPWSVVHRGLEYEGHVIVTHSMDPEYGTPLPDFLPVEDSPANDRDQSIVLTLPPMSVLYLEPRVGSFWSETQSATS